VTRLQDDHDDSYFCNTGSNPVIKKSVYADISPITSDILWY